MGVTRKVIDVGHRRQEGGLRQSIRCLRDRGLLACASLIALLLFAIPASTWAQTAGTGALAGVVTDASGASIPGVEIKVTNLASGEVRSVTSGNNGGYSVALLLPGFYSVEATKAGFRDLTVPKVEVIVTETAALNLRLEVGTVSQKVIVEAQAEELQTESSTLGRVTTSQQIESLPMAMRNFTQIIALNPGVSTEIANAGELGRGGGGNNQDPTVSSGNWAADNNFQMNGVGDNDIQQSGYFSAGVAIPNPDTIEEFKVQTGQYDASYGRNAGANVDVITKGGTNSFHGKAWEYFRNDALNANTFFLNSHDQPRAVLKQNQFGGDFGGPIKKDKLQFFTSYQGTRQRNGLDLNCSAFISEAPLTNDRSAAALGALFAGQTGALGGTAILADGSNINPVALALLNTKLPNGNYLMPTPQIINTSIPYFDAQGSLAFSEACPFTENQVMTNADWEMSSKSKLSARFFFANSGIVYTLPETNVTGGGSPPGSPVDLTQNFRNFSLTHTYIISSTLLNEAEIGYHRIYATFVQAPPGFSWSGVGATVVPQDNLIPALSIDLSASGLELGGNGQNVEIAENTYTFQDSLSWTHGKHNFRFGGGVSREENNQVKFHYLSGEGFLSWADFMLGLPGGTGPGENGTAYSNMYLSLDLLGLFDRGYRDWEGWSYVQDDYHVTKRLTVNLGMRWDHIGDFGDVLGRNAGFDVTLANPNPPAGGTVAGTTVPNNYKGPMPTGVKQLGNDYGLNGLGQNTWNPRIGFAYHLPWTERFVLRGGYGVFHSRSTGQPFLQLISAPPYGDFREFEGPSAATFSEQVPLPLASPTFPTFIPYSPTTLNSITTFAPNYRPPMVQEFSLGLQTELTPSTVLEIGYSGARGLHGLLDRTLDQAALASPSNPIRGQTTNTDANIPLRVPYEGFDSEYLDQIESSAASWYNALLVSLNKRFSHGLQFQASYTFSQSMSTGATATTGANGAVVVGNNDNPASRYGRDNFVRPHRLIVNYMYQFPKMKGGNAFAQQAINGWSVQGVTTFQTGHYLTATTTNANNVYGINGFAADRAQLSGTCTGKQLVTSGSVVSKLNDYINQSCFTPNIPIIGDDGIGTAFGNSGVGIFQGPKELNFDFSVIKHFPVHKIGEAGDLEFRSEFFNVFNHPLFQDPSDLNYGDPGFGQITNTYGNPRIIQFALKLTF